MLNEVTKKHTPLKAFQPDWISIVWVNLPTLWQNKSLHELVKRFAELCHFPSLPVWIDTAAKQSNWQVFYMLCCTTKWRYIQNSCLALQISLFIEELVQVTNLLDTIKPLQLKLDIPPLLVHSLFISRACFKYTRITRISFCSRVSSEIDFGLCSSTRCTKRRSFFNIPYLFDCKPHEMVFKN